VTALQGQALAVDAGRFEQVLRDLALIGADPGGGISRLGLSQAENEARAYLCRVSQEAGLVSEIDPAGNLLVRRHGANPDTPVLLLGSHIDTVKNGGWLDGAYGVVAALEALRVLAAAAFDGPYEPVAVGFANEEGALVQYPFWGSRALAGSLADARAACDRDGQPVGSYLSAAGGDLDRIADATWPPRRIVAYLELHIEQGPLLEQRNIPIGVVDRIVGRTIVEIEVRGESGHAGTTPMSRRKDALIAAAALVQQIESIAGGVHHACATATVGFLTVFPNTTNTIPGTVHLTAEMRDYERERLDRAEALLRSMAAQVGRERGVEVVVRAAHRSCPAITHPAIRSAVQKAAVSLELDCLTMSSPAGHDAQIVAAIAPVGMIFVPSKDGVSHAPAEDTAMPALVAGAQVLLNTALELSPEQLGENRLPP
jgi:beta-ureidopropionase / N-carbamoyl-L-amino-acid hydrolase